MIAGLARSEAPSPARPKVDADREAWLYDRIETALQAVAAVRRARRVAADSEVISGAVEGIINATAVSIIELLGMEPSYINLRRVPERLDAVAVGGVEVVERG